MNPQSTPDKLAYTKNEKIADTLSVIVCITSAVIQIILFAKGVFGPSAIFTSITTLVIGTAFTFVSMYPQHTSLFYGKTDITEQMFRKLRKQSIASKFILSVIIFLIVLL